MVQNQNPLGMLGINSANQPSSGVNPFLAQFVKSAPASTQQADPYAQYNTAVSGPSSANQINTTANTNIGQVLSHLTPEQIANQVVTKNGQSLFFDGVNYIPLSKDSNGNLSYNGHYADGQNFAFSLAPDKSGGYSVANNRAWRPGHGGGFFGDAIGLSNADVLGLAAAAAGAYGLSGLGAGAAGAADAAGGLGAAAEGSGLASLPESVASAADAFGAGAGTAAADAAAAAGSGGLDALAGGTALAPEGAASYGLTSLPSSVNSAADAFGTGGGTIASDAATAAGSGGVDALAPAYGTTVVPAASSYGDFLTNAKNILQGGSKVLNALGAAQTAAGAGNGAAGSAGVPLLPPKVSEQDIKNPLAQLAGPLENLRQLGYIQPGQRQSAIQANGLAQYAKGGKVDDEPEHVDDSNPLFITGKTGHWVQGPGTGQSDSIPARLADGEYVFDADTVAALGDGSNKAGARALDKMRERIRAHKRSAPNHKIPPPAKDPMHYLKGE